MLDYESYYAILRVILLDNSIGVVRSQDYVIRDLWLITDSPLYDAYSGCLEVRRGAEVDGLVG